MPAPSSDGSGSRGSLRVVGTLLAWVLGCLATACFVWGVAQSFVRPPDYPEGCILFNAARIRSGLPLWVDPIAGAHEYGEPPARYFVAYIPIAAAFLATMPTNLALIAGRLGNLLGWYAALAIPVFRARPPCRAPAALAALFCGAMFLFARWSADVKPDGLALLLASLALARSLDRGFADARSGLLFAAAALVKPSVAGMGVGALAASILSSRGRRLGGVLSAGALLLVVLGALEGVSRGRAFEQLRAALGLVFVPSLLEANVASRTPFIAGLIAVAAVASWVATARVKKPVALGALACSVILAAIGLGKIGAASNYLMEPALASVVVLSRCVLPRPRWSVATLGIGGLVALSLAWAGTATIRSLLDEISRFGRDGDALRRIRARCLDAPGAMVISTDPGIELTIDGRIYTPHVELWNAVRLGRFPSSLWAMDMRSPKVRCVVTPVEDGLPSAWPTGLFPGDVADMMRQEYTLAGTDERYAVYVRRASSEPL